MDFLRTISANPFFHKLVLELDAELTDMYGDEMQIFNPLNKLNTKTNALVVIENDIPIGIGAFRILKPNSEIEIKRMYVPPMHRGRGISKKILNELEDWAVELGYCYSRLETGTQNIAALGLYAKAGYDRIEPFGPYKNIDNSICFGKKIK